MAYNTYPTYNAYQPYPANSYQQQYSPVMQPMQTNPYMSQGNIGNSGYAAQQQIIISDLVDGDVGARSYRPSTGWIPNALYALFDMNDPIIYFRSTNQFGVPNKIQSATFTMNEPKVTENGNHQQYLQSGENKQPTNSQQIQPAQQMLDMSEYVKKEDMERMKEELKAAMTSNMEMKGEKGNGKPAV